MEKTSPTINIVEIVNQEIQSINDSIEHAKKQRDESATPMESAHDQTRQLADQLVQALKRSKEELYEIKTKLINTVPPLKAIATGSYVEIKNIDSKEIRKYLIVPEGLGGKKIEDIILLSDHAPLAQNLIGQKIGHLFEISSTKYVISNTTPQFSKC